MAIIVIAIRNNACAIGSRELKPVNSDKMIRFLTEKWKGRSCPLCGTGNWNVQDMVFQLTAFSEGNMILGGPLIPVIPVSCDNCGNTILVNAIVAGAVSPVPAEVKGK